MRRVGILAFDECLASSIAAVTDVMAIANQLWRRRHPEADALFAWKLLSIDGSPVTSSSGLRFDVAGRAQGSFDVLFVPPVHYRDDEALLSSVDRIAAATGGWIRKHGAAGACLSAGCSGAFVLASLGLLDGKRATTSWWLEPLFRRRFPEVELRVEELVVRDGRMLSAGPVNAHFDLALDLVEEEAGRALALDCARVMLLDASRRSQLPYVVLRSEVHHEDSLVAKAQRWMRDRMRDDVTIAEVARAVGTSPRNLIRRFKQATDRTPLHHLQELRLETAKRLLETTDLDVDAIVERIGYHDASSFRRLFRDRTAVSPREYRKRFADRR